MERFIRPMAPGWFASVMGTAVTSLALTLASHAAADAGPALAAPVALAASALHWLAIAMMSVLGIAAIYRLIRHGDAVMEQLRHPVEGSFYATFPIAMLVMAAVWTIRGVSPALIAPLWWTGALGTFAVSYVVLFGLFTSERLKLGMVTPAHFIPAVGLVVIPVAGAPLAAASEGVLRELAFALNMTGFGAGVFMYVGLLALTMARHFLGAPVEGKMTPPPLGAPGAAERHPALDARAPQDHGRRLASALRLPRRGRLPRRRPLVARARRLHDDPQPPPGQAPVRTLLVGLRLPDRRLLGACLPRIRTPRA